MSGITKGPWVVREFKRPHNGIDLIGYRVIAPGQCNGDDLQICEAYPAPHPVAVNLDNFRALAEAPAMVAALRDLVKGNYGQPWAVNVPALDAARAILSRIDGATPTDEPAAPTGEDAHRFTVIWGNIGDDAGKRLDHVTVKDATHSAIMDAAFACFFADMEAAGEILSESDRDEFRNHTAYDGFAILPGHVTDAPGLGF